MILHERALTGAILCFDTEIDIEIDTEILLRRLPRRWQSNTAQQPGAADLVGAAFRQPRQKKGS